MWIAFLLVLTVGASTVRAEYAEVGGLKIYHEVHGEGRPVVFLHGGGWGNIEDWKAQIPKLARHYRVIAVEQMGHGRTADDPSRDLSYESMAEDTAALLAKLGVHSADFIGSSDGGQIALRLAITHPKLVRKVVASGVALGVSALPSDLQEWIETMKADEVPPEELEAYKRLAPEPEHWPAFFERVRRIWLQPAWGFTEAELRQITSPTLIVSGDQDYVPIEHSVALVRLIPSAQLCVLPGTGHDTFETRADWLDPIVLAFLEAPMPDPDE